MAMPRASLATVGNLGGNAQHTRHLVNKAFLQDMAKA
jgi:hypothetical protein